jgi:hypothetical protein
MEFTVIASLHRVRRDGHGTVLSLDWSMESRYEDLRINAYGDNGVAADALQNLASDSPAAVDLSPLTSCPDKKMPSQGTIFMGSNTNHDFLSNIMRRVGKIVR